MITHQDISEAAIKWYRARANANILAYTGAGDRDMITDAWVAFHQAEDHLLNLMRDYERQT